MVEFSLVKWSKCLGCHMVVKKGTHIDNNLTNFCDVILRYCCCHNEDSTQVIVAINQGTPE